MNNPLFSQTEDRDYFKSNNVCEVKTIIFFNNGKKPEVIYKRKYDSNGNNIKSLTFDSNNKLTSEYEYKYDEQNNQISFTENGKENNENNYERKYDDKKNLIEESGKSFNVKYYYDSLNRVSKKVHTNQENKETKEILFKYDNNGNKIAEYVESNSFYLNEFSKYNSNNQIIEKEVYYHLDNKNELYERTIYDYNDNKLLVSKKSIDGYAKGKDIEYSYYDNNKLKSVKVIEGSLTTYFYKGNLITKKETFQNLLNFTVVEQYEYMFCK